jgi:hypothetical protein
MWNDGMVNDSAAKMQHQKLLREAEQRRLVKALRQYQNGSNQPAFHARVARLWMNVGQLIAPGAAQARRVRPGW